MTLSRQTPMPRPVKPMKRTRVRQRRTTPRRREAPRWSAEEWETANHQLMVRSGGCCEMCGDILEGHSERAHRVRRRDGGDRLANLLLLHPFCHAWTHAHPVEAGALGLILATHQDPAAVPVWHRATGWVLLDDNGNTIPTDDPNESELP